MRRASELNKERGAREVGTHRVRQWHDRLGAQRARSAVDRRSRDTREDHDPGRRASWQPEPVPPATTARSRGRARSSPLRRDFGHTRTHALLGVLDAVRHERDAAQYAFLLTSESKRFFYFAIDRFFEPPRRSYLLNSVALMP